MVFLQIIKQYMENLLCLFFRYSEYATTQHFRTIIKFSWQDCSWISLYSCMPWELRLCFCSRNFHYQGTGPHLTELNNFLRKWLCRLKCLHWLFFTRRMLSSRIEWRPGCPEQGKKLVQRVWTTPTVITHEQYQLSWKNVQVHWKRKGC